MTPQQLEQIRIDYANRDRWQQSLTDAERIALAHMPTQQYEQLYQQWALQQEAQAQRDKDAAKAEADRIKAEQDAKAAAEKAAKDEADRQTRAVNLRNEWDRINQQGAYDPDGWQSIGYQPDPIAMPQGWDGLVTAPPPAPPAAPPPEPPAAPPPAPGNLLARPEPTGAPFTGFTAPPVNHTGNALLQSLGGNSKGAWGAWDTKPAWGSPGQAQQKQGTAPQPWMPGQGAWGSSAQKPAGQITFGQKLPKKWGGPL